MHATPPITLCDEAAWIGREILLLAKDAGLTADDAQQFQTLTIRLANAVFAKNAVCLPIESPSDQNFLERLLNKKTSLLASEAGAETPLVFDSTTQPGHPTLYFRKQFAEEVFIAQTVKRLAQNNAENIPEEIEKIITAGPDEGFAFPLSLEQQNAVRTLLSKQFTIISGGPGTGKTSLLLRALICLLKKKPDARIAIAAPTGKAAARVRESVAGQISALNPKIQAALFERTIPEKISQIIPTTLHRLLGISVYSPAPKPFFADVIIVDEASMVSQTLMAALLQACPPEATLILLGDKNQLDSVQPGHVFGDFYSAPALSGSRVTLEQSHRFNRHNFIGKLADSVLCGNASDALTMLNTAIPENHFVEPCLSANRRAQIEKALAATLPKELKNPPGNTDPKALLLALEASRILTPMAEGAFGKEELNRVARNFFGAPANGEHFHGRPILITQNAPEQKLNNGDIGIVLRTQAPRETHPQFQAWFLDENNQARAIPTAFLPPHETAYAMTIHKSQGSEFKRLCLFFPKIARTDFYSKQLLYTAITRFKESEQSRFAFIFDEAAVDEAIRTESASHSLLTARLQ